MKSASVHPARRRAPSLFARTLVTTLALAAGAVLAAPEEKFLSAFSRFKAAAAGDASAVESASDAFAALLESEPDNPVLMAYAGAATSMRAKTTVMPWKKMAYVEDGLAQIDKALALAGPGARLPAQRGTPGHLEVKFVSANTMLAVPAFLNRNARGAKLLNEVLSSPAFAAAPVGFRGEVLLRAVDLAVEQKRNADAHRLANEVVALGAPQADAAKTKVREVAP